MAGDVVAESLAHLINFTASRQFRVPKPPLTASGKPLDKIRHGFAFNFLRMMAPFTLSISFLQLV